MILREVYLIQGDEFLEPKLDYSFRVYEGTVGLYCDTMLIDSVDIIDNGEIMVCTEDDVIGYVDYYDVVDSFKDWL